MEIAEREVGFIDLNPSYKDIKVVTKNDVFKSILNDINYSLGVSIKKMTDVNARVRLSRIRMEPMHRNGVIVVGRIKNLVGGKVSCLLDSSLLMFLDQNINYYIEGMTSLEVFMMDFFDCFSSMSRTNLIEVNPCNFELVDRFLPDSLYYISFDVRIYSNDRVISSKFIVSLDEITSLYF